MNLNDYSNIFIGKQPKDNSFKYEFDFGLKTKTPAY